MFDPVPAEVDAYLARRAELGLDRFDEMREGVYHMVPAPHPRHAAVQARVLAVLEGAVASPRVAVGPVNIGVADDYRIPDAAVVEAAALRRGDAFLPGAALVVEVVSPGEDGRGKAGFYAAWGVAELVVVAPDGVEIVDLESGERLEFSELLGLTVEHLAALLGDRDS